MPNDGRDNGRKPHLKIFPISSLNVGDNRLFVMEYVNKIPCRVTLKTVTGYKINVYLKVYLNITFGDAIYHHVVYVADISDPFIFGLDFLRENNF